VGASVLAVVLSGLAPALLVTRSSLFQALRSGAVHLAGQGRRTRDALVMGQEALAVVVVLGAGLMTRSFLRLPASPETRRFWMDRTLRTAREREMAFVVIDPRPGREDEGYAVARLSIDPDFEEAEYAIIVRSDCRGLGLGPLLMRRLIDYARGRGVRRVVGDVLRDNRSMLRLCEALGFETEHSADEPGLVHVELEL